VCVHASLVRDGADCGLKLDGRARWERRCVFLLFIYEKEEGADGYYGLL
jgi:hypothetical protein